jgi:hypothetical protein
MPTADGLTPRGSNQTCFQFLPFQKNIGNIGNVGTLLKSTILLIIFLPIAIRTSVKWQLWNQLGLIVRLIFCEELRWKSLFKESARKLSSLQHYDALEPKS